MLETISAITALVIAVSVVITAVFSARKGAEDTLRSLVTSQGERIKELESKLEKRDAMIAELNLKNDELEKRVNVLSAELQKITHPKMKTGRLKRKV